MPRHPEILTAAEVDALAKKLKTTVTLAERALALVDAFETGAPAKATKTAAKKAPAPKARRGKRRAAIDPAKIVELLAAAKNGLSAGDVAKKLGEDRPRVSIALAALRTAGQAKMTGVKRNARWFAVAKK